MAFDLGDHQDRQILIKAAILRRRKLGLPEEKNISTLLKEISLLLGIPVSQVSSKDVNHSPSPSEMKNEKGELSIPNKPCPKCGNMTFLNSICPSCEASEGGKFKSGYTCDQRRGGCGFVDDKTGEWIYQRLSRMKEEGTFQGELPQGMKADIGIRTITDKGLK